MLIFRAWATRDVHGKQPMIIKVVDNRASVGQKQKYEHHAINAQTRDIHLHVYHINNDISHNGMHSPGC